MSKNLTTYRGDDYTLNLTFRTSAGAVINITGYTIFMTVKAEKTDLDAAALISKTVTNHSDPTNGITAIALSSSDTNVTPGTYFYDIQMKDGAGKITTVMDGLITFSQDITLRTV